jgi:hypothetical protein
VEAGAAKESGAASDGHTHESACLNCGTQLIGDHCHACGQRAHVHRTLGAFFHDLLHGVLHLEGKTWRTLPMLAWRPGELTRRYIDGERARFVSPLGLFLFTVFLMFVVFSSIGGPLPPDTTSQVQTGMTESAKAVRGQVAELERRRDAMAAAGQPLAEIEAQLEQQRKEAILMDQVEREGLLRGFGHRVVDDLPEGFGKRRSRSSTRTRRSRSTSCRTTPTSSAGCWSRSWCRSCGCCSCGGGGTGRFTTTRCS